MIATDIMFEQGLPNPGGIKEVVYYAPISDFLVIPKPADLTANAVFGTVVTIEEDYTFKVGKCFRKLYCTLETGEVKSTMVGPTDSRGFENMAEISYPGNDANFLGFVAASANERFIVLVAEQNGKVRVIGSKDFPAQVQTYEGTGGKANADGRKNMVSVKGYGATPAPIYTGEITLTPAA